MLAELKIENVAVIEKAEVQFTPGLNVLTGETGAGKSIMIDPSMPFWATVPRVIWCAAVRPRHAFGPRLNLSRPMCGSRWKNAAMVPRMTCCCTARSARRKRQLPY